MPTALPDRTRRLAFDVRSLELTDDAFYRLCQDNPELDIELTADGELIVMTPAGAESGHCEARIIQRLSNWSDENGEGIVFSSSAGFTLPNGARRAPDAAWISRSRWNELTRSEQQVFAPICPDFVVELRSPSDIVPELQAKLAEYIANGASLGWLLDPTDRKAWIYRPATPAACVEDPTILDGAPVLPGFRFDFREIL